MFGITFDDVVLLGEEIISLGEGDIDSGERFFDLDLHLAEEVIFFTHQETKAMMRMTTTAAITIPTIAPIPIKVDAGFM